MFHTYFIAYTQHLCIHIPVKQKIKPNKKKKIGEASHNMIWYLCPAPKNWEPVVSMLDGWKERQLNEKLSHLLIPSMNGKYTGFLGNPSTYEDHSCNKLSKEKASDLNH